MNNPLFLLLGCIALAILPAYGQTGYGTPAPKVVTLYRFTFDAQISNPDLRERIQVAFKKSLQALCPDVVIRSDLGYFDPELEEAERIRLVQSIDELVEDLTRYQRQPAERELSRINRAVATDYLLLATVRFRPESAAAAYTLSYRIYRLIDLATFEDQFSWGADAVEIADLNTAMRTGLRAVAICGTTDVRTNTRKNLDKELAQLVSAAIDSPEDTLVRGTIDREIRPDPVLYGLYLSQRVSALEQRLVRALERQRTDQIDRYRELLLATYDTVLAYYPHSQLIQDSYRKRRAEVGRM